MPSISFSASVAPSICNVKERVGSLLSLDSLGEIEIKEVWSMRKINMIEQYEGLLLISVVALYTYR